MLMTFLGAKLYKKLYILDIGQSFEPPSPTLDNQKLKNKSIFLNPFHDLLIFFVVVEVWFTYDDHLSIFTRPCVAVAVPQTPLSFINYIIPTCVSCY